MIAASVVPHPDVEDDPLDDLDYPGMDPGNPMNQTPGRPNVPGAFPPKPPPGPKKPQLPFDKPANVKPGMRPFDKPGSESSGFPDNVDMNDPSVPYRRPNDANHVMPGFPNKGNRVPEDIPGDTEESDTDDKSFKCKDYPSGLRRLTLGVDIRRIQLRPLLPTDPDGFAWRLFDFTCVKERKWKNPTTKQHVDIPDQIASFFTKSTGKLSVSSQVFTRFADLRREELQQDGLTVDFGVGMRAADILERLVGGNANVSGVHLATDAYKELNKDLKSGKSVITKSTAYVSKRHAELEPPEAMELRPVVRRILASLPESFAENPSGYRKFIRDFGTHYITAADLGGMIYSLFKTDSKFYEKYGERVLVGLTEENLSANIDANFGFGSTYNNGKQASVSDSIEVSKATVNQFKRSTTSNIRYYGGKMSPTEEIGNMSYPMWVRSIDDSPWILTCKLIPVYELVNYDPKRQKALKDALEDHVFDDQTFQELKNLLKNVYDKRPPRAFEVLLPLLDEVDTLLQQDPRPSGSAMNLIRQMNFHLVSKRRKNLNQMPNLMKRF